MESIMDTHFHVVEGRLEAMDPDKIFPKTYDDREEARQACKKLWVQEKHNNPLYNQGLSCWIVECNEKH